MIFIHYLPYLPYLCKKKHIYGSNGKERTHGNPFHEYYGSIANIYEFHSSEELGITYGSLRNYGLTADKPYMNNKCTIRKGVLHQKAGGRGIKKTNI